MGEPAGLLTCVGVKPLRVRLPPIPQADPARRWLMSYGTRAETNGVDLPQGDRDLQGE